MRKKIAFATLGLVLLASPLVSSADTLSDLQTQIASLLAQVAKLQEQLKLIQTTSPVACTQEARLCPDGTSVGRTGSKCEFAPCGGTTPILSCPILNRSLSFGASGDDVSSLQAFLGVAQTGYFGSVTESAVQNLQKQDGIVTSGTPTTTGFGAVGAKTRAALIRRCGSPNQGISAAPTSGTVPLTVQFKSGVTGTINFGDGTSGTMVANCVGSTNNIRIGEPSSCLTDSYYTSHTYTTAGTYTAKFTQNTQCGTTNSVAGNPIYCPSTTSTVTISVGGGSASGPSISALDAPTFLSVGQSGTWTVHASVGNGTGSLNYSVVWGDEPIFSQIQASDAALAAQLVQTSSTFTHSYASAGTYKPTFTVSNTAGSAQTSASVVVGGVVTPPCCKNAELLSATPTSGTAPLSVNFTSNSFGIVNFGDGTSGSLTAANGVCANSISGSCTYSISHTYASAGAYTATLNGRSVCGQTNSVPSSPIYCENQTLGTVTITVTRQDISTPVPSPTLTATPSSGAVPLSVNFTSNVSGTLDFGDGTSVTLQQNPTTAYYCVSNCVNPSPVYSASHTYSSAGIYTATLTSTTYNTCKGLSDYACPSYLSAITILGTATVTVKIASNTSAAALYVFPSSGSAPFKATFTLTGGNASTDSINFGDGSAASSAWSPDSESNSLFLTHAYATPGVYLATVTRLGTCGFGNNGGCTTSTLGTVKVVVTGAAASVGSTPNLANALTALESALKALVANLGR